MYRRRVHPERWWASEQFLVQFDARSRIEGVSRIFSAWTPSA
jgi:hypothetical protein